MGTQKIVSIRKIERKDRYDLTVNSTHNFFANGVLIHNTSGRTGRVLWKKRNLWQKILGVLGLYKDSYRLITGTRRVVYDPDKMNVPDNGYYAGSMYRNKIHDWFSTMPLKDGEIVYYEIVGWTDTGAAIMGEHGLSALGKSGVSKSEYKNYPEPFVFSYGCKKGEYKVYVYRITQDGKDLSWSDMKLRCEELNIEPVPELGEIVVGNDTEQDIMLKCESFTTGTSVLDVHHFREGICLLRIGMRVK